MEAILTELCKNKKRRIVMLKLFVNVFFKLFMVIMYYVTYSSNNNLRVIKFWNHMSNMLIILSTDPSSAWEVTRKPRRSIRTNLPHDVLPRRWVLLRRWTVEALLRRWGHNSYQRQLLRRRGDTTPPEGASTPSSCSENTGDSSVQRQVA